MLRVIGYNRYDQQYEVYLNKEHIEEVSWKERYNSWRITMSSGNRHWVKVLPEGLLTNIEHGNKENCYPDEDNYYYNTTSYLDDEIPF